MQAIPSVLYKYCSPERTDVLINKKICFSPPSQLNDILEMKPPVSLDRAKMTIPIPPTWAADNTKAIHETLENARVLCLCEEWCSLPLWSYYAYGHRGFVIGFSTDSDLLNRREQMLRRVRYTKERSTIEFGKTLDDAIFSKATDWQHEREWRSMRTVEECEPHPWFVSFDTTAVKEVYIGNRAQGSLDTLLKCILSSDVYKHVRVYTITPSTTFWELERDRVDIYSR